VANRVALECMVKARNEGKDIKNEGPDILRKAAQLLHAAEAGAGHLGRHQLQLRVHRHQRLRRHSRHVELIPATKETLTMMTNPTGRLTQGQFSFLPDLTDARSRCRSSTACARATPGASNTPTTRTRATPTGRCTACPCSTCATPPA
jgi:hypothetical protein